jgi:hypothetical protein
MDFAINVPANPNIDLLQMQDSYMADLSLANTEKNLLTANERIDALKKLLNPVVETIAFEKFYSGFYSFSSMNHCGDYIIFSVPSPQHVPSSILLANARIKQLNLPLEAVSTGDRTKTFIVKKKATA